MNPEELGSRLRKFQDFQHDHAVKTVVELDALLTELNDMASEIQSLPAGDIHASSARIDELRRQYTAWYNAAVASEATPAVDLRPQTLEELDLEYHRCRQDWSTAEDTDRAQLVARISACLDSVESRPDGELVAAPIRKFLATAATPEHPDKSGRGT